MLALYQKIKHIHSTIPHFICFLVFCLLLAPFLDPLSWVDAQLPCHLHCFYSAAAPPIKGPCRDRKRSLNLTAKMNNIPYKSKPSQFSFLFQDEAGGEESKPFNRKIIKDMVGRIYLQRKNVSR